MGGGSVTAQWCAPRHQLRLKEFPCYRFKSCGFFAPGSVMSCGLLRRETSCELLGLTPGARPVVTLSAGEGGLTVGGLVVPGPGPVGLGVDEPGDADVPPPLVPPELCASTNPPDSAKIATIAPKRFMMLFLLC
jgi:hypothetical protein